jgi:hypothetical protein
MSVISQPAQEFGPGTSSRAGWRQQAIMHCEFHIGINKNGVVFSKAIGTSGKINFFHLLILSKNRRLCNNEMKKNGPLPPEKETSIACISKSGTC